MSYVALLLVLDNRAAGAAGARRGQEGCGCGCGGISGSLIRVTYPSHLSESLIRVTAGTTEASARAHRLPDGYSQPRTHTHGHTRTHTHALAAEQASESRGVCCGCGRRLGKSPARRLAQPRRCRAAIRDALFGWRWSWRGGVELATADDVMPASSAFVIDMQDGGCNRRDASDIRGWRVQFTTDERIYKTPVPVHETADVSGICSSDDAGASARIDVGDEDDAWHQAGIVQHSVAAVPVSIALAPSYIIHILRKFRSTLPSTSSLRIVVEWAPLKTVLLYREESRIGTYAESENE